MWLKNKTFKSFSATSCKGETGPVLTEAAAGAGTGAGVGLGGWGMVFEPAWEERPSLTEGGEGNRGITGGTEDFFLLEGVVIFLTEMFLFIAHSF